MSPQAQDWVDNLKPGGVSGPSSLAAERAGSPVDTDALAHHLLGPVYLERQERILKILQEDKLFSKENVMNLSRPDWYMLGPARGMCIRQLQDKHGWSFEEHAIEHHVLADSDGAGKRDPA